MKNTSAGYHTFSFYQKVNSDDYSMLINDFVMYRHKNDNKKDFPIKDKDGKTIGWEYTYKTFLAILQYKRRKSMWNFHSRL